MFAAIQYLMLDDFSLGSYLGSLYETNEEDIMEPVGPSVWEIIRLFLIIFAIGGLLGLTIWYFQKLAKRKKARVPSPKEKTKTLKSSEKTSPPKPEIIESRQEPSKPKPEKIKESPKIFISYRRDDSNDITGRIYDWLVRHFGEDNVFKDVDSIPLGVDFKQHLDQAVAQCSVFLTVIGPNWLFTSETAEKSRLHNSADFVRIELESALQRDIPLIPLFVREATMPSEEDLPDRLKSLVFRNGVSIRPDPDFHNDMNRLIRAIDVYLKS
jgi:hypothetical protein